MSSAAALFGFTVVACAHAGEGSSTSTVDSTSGPEATSTTVTLDAGAGRAPVELEVRETAGIAPSRVRTIFAPAAEPLARCVAGASGKITVHVTTRDGRLRLDVDPSGLLDTTSRACAEGVLTNVYREQTGENGGGPAVPPSGFTSLVTFVW